MLFTDPVFLYNFLPLVLAAYFLAPRWSRNGLLLIASLAFYAWGEGKYVLVLLVSIGMNFLLGLGIGRLSPGGARRWLLGLGVAANLSILVAFKYSMFLVANGRALMSTLGVIQEDRFFYVYMPIGISFFTFQAISYLIDVARGDVPPSRNPVDYAMYKAFFPQLIAGPIVRYIDVADQVKSRSVTADQFATGIRRFVGGLGKKMIVANTAAFTADQIFGLRGVELTTSLAWLGIVCYTVQIYFDFSGYSDMAIGLGKMFGFDFLENFHFPYVARSITDFWRRWHRSLSNWFRDYLYIPLGGNRRSPFRTYFNLMMVFFLCGLWHGASWNFILWGLYHGAFLVLERLFLDRLVDGAPSILRHAYVLLVIMVGWVLFRTETLAEARTYLGAMSGLHRTSGYSPSLAYYLSPKLIFALAAAVVLSTPVLSDLAGRVRGLARSPRPVVGGLLQLATDSLLLAVLFVSMTLIAAGSYNPFIYFRF